MKHGLAPRDLSSLSILSIRLVTRRIALVLSSVKETSSYECALRLL